VKQPYGGPEAAGKGQSMKTGAGLALVCVGAILAFAVTGNTSFFNIHTAGWVLMLVGIIGLLLPGRTYGWLGRRLLVRRTYPAGRAGRVSPYGARTPGTPALEAGRPTLLDQEGDLIEDGGVADYDDMQPGQPGTARRGTVYVPPSRQPAATTEVIEDLYEQP
jgi:hypothetical protein